MVLVKLCSWAVCRLGQQLGSGSRVPAGPTNNVALHLGLDLGFLIFRQWLAPYTLVLQLSLLLVALLTQRHVCCLFTGKFCVHLVALLVCFV